MDYISNFVYENNELKYILTPEGRVMANPDGTFEYQYFLKDHLGNTRVTFTQTGEVIQEDSYYPFGMSMTGLNYETDIDYKNKYLYNGKELQDEFGLDWYDYGARFYDAVLGRFHTIDPLSEDYYYQSPFIYGTNNPIRFIDFMGMSASPYYDENGNFLGVDENGFAGEIYITDQATFDANSTSGVADSKSIQKDEKTESIGTANLSDESLSNVYSDVITKMDEVSSDELYKGQVSIFNGKGSYDYNTGEMKYAGHNDPDNFLVFGYSDTKDGKHKITVGQHGHSEITTVENVQNALGVHEFTAHGIKGIRGGNTKEHAKAYEMQMNHPTWKNTTPNFKKDMIKRYNYYLKFD